MMKRAYVLCAILICLLSLNAMALKATEITYETTDLGSGRWQYTYEVSNIDFQIDQQQAMVQEFTISFDDDFYDNLAITTQAPLSTAWDEICWQGEGVIDDPGAYDALILAPNGGIAVGESVYGFSVAFDWLGAGAPGAQYYEIIDPGTFEIIGAGYTIPEPCSLVLLGLGGLALRRSKSKRNQKDQTLT
jgi:hypothetical protein